MYWYYISSGVRKFCPSSKFPDESSAGLTRLDCMFLAATACAQGHSITINAAVAFIAFLHYLLFLLFPIFGL